MALLEIFKAYPYAFYIFLGLALLGLCTLLGLLCSAVWWIICHTSKNKIQPVDYNQNKRINELESKLSSVQSMESELEELRKQVSGH